MAKDLTTSSIDRQNILNNVIALPRIQEKIELSFLEYKGVYYITKQQVADFFEVDVRTISNILSNNEDELNRNGYKSLKGKDLKDFKSAISSMCDIPAKTTVLGVFDFRAFLNIGMLLTTSEKAKQLRSLILDIVICTINEKTGGGTKFINSRDVNFLPSAISEENYHKNLTDSISKFVDGHKTYKYPQIMDMIYKAVFLEKAKEYKKLLELSEKDNLRRTLYSEVLKAVSSFENGAAFEIQKMAETKQCKLTIADVSSIINQLAAHPLMEPIIFDARQKMASRDLAFRDVYHGNIAAYIKAVSPEEYSSFIGSLSVEFDKILENNQDVLERLKK